MHSILFESIIRTSGADTDDIHSGEADSNFWAETPLFERILKEMAETNPDQTAKNLRSKYNLYKNEINEENRLAQKIIDEYAKTSSGTEVEYRPRLSNNNPVENRNDANQFIDEVIARLQKMIKATMNFYAELKDRFINWWETIQ